MAPKQQSKKPPGNGRSGNKFVGELQQEVSNLKAQQSQADLNWGFDDDFGSDEEEIIFEQDSRTTSRQKSNLKKTDNINETRNNNTSISTEKELKMNDRMIDIDYTTPNKRGSGEVSVAPRNTTRDVGDKVLVPEKAGDQGRVTYTPLKKYAEEKGLSGDALKEDLDKKAILIKSDSGTYLTKAQTFNTTYVDPKLSKDEKAVARQEKFGQKMEELGLSDKSFAELKKEKLTPEERNIETPGGKRRVAFNYENPVQAGRDSPDVLIKEKDGRFTGVYPKLEGSKSLDELAGKVGGRENVMLKTTGNSYLPADTYNDRKGPQAAEKAFAKMAEAPINLERNDMPKAFYKVADGVYASKDKYEELRKNDAYKDKIPEDRSKTEALFQSPSGQGLVTPKTLKFLDKDGAANTIKSEGLDPDKLKTPRIANANKPEAMVYLEKEGMLISAERAKALAPNKPLDEVFKSKDIYIQNKGKNGELTGNYADKDSFERNNPKGVAFDRMASAGITESKTANRINETYSVQNLTQNMHQLDTRERSRGSSGREIG